MNELIITGIAALAYAGAHYHAYFISKKLQQSLLSVELEVTEAGAVGKNKIHEAITLLGQRIEISKVGQRIPRIICQLCSRLVHNYNEKGICADCAKVGG